jgi:hypothetical protein
MRLMDERYEAADWIVFEPDIVLKTPFGDKDAQASAARRSRRMRAEIASWACRWPSKARRRDCLPGPHANIVGRGI